MMRTKHYRRAPMWGAAMTWSRKCSASQSAWWFRRNLYFLIFKIEKFDISCWQFQAISQRYAAERIVAQTTFNLPTVGWKRDFTVATSLFSAAECATLPPRRRVGFVLMMILWLNFFRADEWGFGCVGNRKKQLDVLVRYLYAVEIG